MGTHSDEDVCFRHPEKSARRKCFRCRKAICPACQLRGSGHIWCGPPCEKRFAIEERGRRILSLAHSRVPTSAFFVVTLVLGISTALFVSRSVATLTDLGGSVSDLWSRPSPLAIPAAPPPRADILAVESGDGRTAVVRGKADPGVLVFLFRSDELVGARLATPAGEFRFEAVPVDPSRPATFRVGAVRPSSMTASGDVRLDPRLAAAAAAVPNILRGDPKRRQLVLTLDAGSNSLGALEILDVLKSFGIRTTLFFTGEFVQRYPDLARRAVEDGHEIGNHSYSHLHLTTFEANRRHDTLPAVTKEVLQDELRRTADLFRETTGAVMAPFWRAPYGEQNREIRGWAAELGYTHIGWTHGPDYGMDALDWVTDTSAKNYFSAKDTVARLLEFDDRTPGGAAGGIILMHLGTDRTEGRFDAELPTLIEGYRAKGFSWVRVSDLLAARMVASK